MNKYHNMKRLSLPILLVLGLHIPESIAAEYAEYIAIGSGIHLREFPNTSSNIVNSIKFGEILSVDSATITTNGSTLTRIGIGAGLRKSI